MFENHFSGFAPPLIAQLLTVPRKPSKQDEEPLAKPNDQSKNRVFFAICSKFWRGFRPYLFENGKKQRILHHFLSTSYPSYIYNIHENIIFMEILCTTF